MRTINYESDFKIIEGFVDGSSILAAPFKFTYYTKVSRGVYVASYDGTEFVNCHPTDDGRVVVPFDNPQFGMGVLNVKREFFLNDKDFADGICNLVSVESTGIILDRGATDMDGEVNIELFPFYQRGLDGEDGKDGADGKSAYDLWLEEGNEGSVADFLGSLKGGQGSRGEDGADAYEVWLQAGNEGSVQDFLDSLKGEKGEDGKDGKDGVDGKDGADGAKGEKGDKMTYDDLTEEEKDDLASHIQVIGGGSSISGKVSFVGNTQGLDNAIKSPKLNEIKYYLISDPDDKLPSGVTCYDIPSNVVQMLNTTTASGSIVQAAINAAISLAGIQFQPIGVNVGDLVAFTLIEVSVEELAESLGINLGLSGTLQMYQYKILATNDAKAPNSGQSSVGVMGLMSPWDKQQINKVDGIESTANNALPKKDRLPSLWNDNMNNALSTGVYPWCNLGRPSGSTGHYTCIVNRTSTDDGSFDTIEQTAYGREGELGKVYKRIIFQHKNGNETQYGEWIDITSSGESGSFEFTEHCIINSDTDEVAINGDSNTKSTVGVSFISKDANLDVFYPCLSIYDSGNFYVFAFDYIYSVTKDSEGIFVVTDKYQTNSERYATKDDVSTAIANAITNTLNTEV